jgi:hypothetical protein
MSDEGTQLYYPMMMSKLFSIAFKMTTSEAKRLIANGGARIYEE